ncbi:MAG: DUF177 domain-containing protein [Dehalococcoidia bacterium]|nr:DUF177 domain-containing protein [Dehalococcoidia bacterium]MDH4300132.1 DUF177 domain-containing protein [Dehalococcoidia bacterium]MDH4367780.1 DUF177 domain-containing protein [Dehalococcoidia bacterium]
MNRERLKALMNVTQLLREPVGSSQSYDISGILGDEMEGSVEGTAKMVRITRGVLVQCELNGQVKLICSRCLDVFLCPISFSAEEEFVPISDVSGDLAISSAGQSEEFTIDDKNMIDLGELIRQYVLLNLPMKALCRPDCPGIREENSNAATT